MRRSRGLAVMVLAVALALGSVAAPRAATAAEQPSETIAGLVTKVDHVRGLITVRSSDLEIHQFKASAETLKDMKVGDRIEAKRRRTPN